MRSSNLRGPAVGILAVAGTLLLSTSAVAQATAEIGPDWGVQELVGYAVEHSPEMAAARLRHEAAGDRVSQERALPDPNLGVLLALVPIETRVGPQRGQIYLSQQLPGKGKRPARAGLAEAEAQALERDLDRVRYRLAYEVAGVYSDLYFLDRAIEITRGNRDVVVFLEQAVRKAYETGSARYADLIRSQVEIGKLENELVSLTEQARSVQERLNALLHRPSGSFLPEPVLDAGPMSLMAEEELRSRLAAGSPVIAVLDAELERDAGRARLADVQDRPDWTFWLRYFPTDASPVPGTPDSGRDAVLAGVSVNLPIWRDKHKAARREADVLERETLARRAATQDRLRDRLERAIYLFHNADREIGLYRDTLLPKAEQSFEASLAGVRTGSAGALELVDAQRVLLQFQLASERALSERARSLAELRMLVGSEVLASPPSPEAGTEAESGS